MSFTVVKSTEIKYDDEMLVKQELVGHTLKYYSILEYNNTFYLGYGKTIDESIEDAKKSAGI
jgi:hypothetical protein